MARGFAVNPERGKLQRGKEIKLRDYQGEAGELFLENGQDNMYGCQPCPECGSAYRCVFAKTPKQIDCDDCGHVEVITENHEEDT